MELTARTKRSPELLEGKLRTAQTGFGCKVYDQVPRDTVGPEKKIT
jgi:hypothetical protein